MELERIQNHPYSENFASAVKNSGLKPQLEETANSLAMQSVKINSGPEIISFLSKRAETGDTNAQFELGVMLYDLKSLKVEAESYFKLAADKGHVEAQYFYAAMRYFGEGEAVDTTEGLKYFKLAADNGHVKAQHLYAAIRYSGEDGAGVDKTEALNYFKLAADNGNVNSQYLYAVMRYSGEGGAVDTTEGLKYFKLAADKGHPAAQHAYAEKLHMNGNVGEACNYFFLAGNTVDYQHYCVDNSATPHIIKGVVTGGLMFMAGRLLERMGLIGPPRG